MTVSLLLIEIGAPNGGSRFGKKPDAGLSDHEAFRRNTRNDVKGLGALPTVDIRVGPQFEKSRLHAVEQGGILSLLCLSPFLVRNISKQQYGPVDHALV